MLGIGEEEILAARRSTSADPKLGEALRFARAVVEQRGGVSDAELSRLRLAGYSH